MIDLYNQGEGYCWVPQLRQKSTFSNQNINGPGRGAEVSIIYGQIYILDEYDLLCCSKIISSLHL